MAGSADKTDFLPHPLASKTAFQCCHAGATDFGRVRRFRLDIDVGAKLKPECVRKQAEVVRHVVAYFVKDDVEWLRGDGDHKWFGRQNGV